MIDFGLYIFIAMLVSEVNSFLSMYTCVCIHRHTYIIFLKLFLLKVENIH